MLLMSSVGGMPGLTDPLASRPPAKQLLFASARGVGVGGVAVAGRTRKDELTAPIAPPPPPQQPPPPPTPPRSSGLKLPCEWLGETAVTEGGTR